MQNLGFFPKTWRYEVTKDIKGIQYAMHLMQVCVTGYLITSEWDRISNQTGFISNNPKAAKRGGHAVLTHSLKMFSSDPNENWIADYTSWGRVGWRQTGYLRMLFPQWKRMHMYSLIIYPE